MNNMTCRDGATLVTDYLEGALPDDLRVAIDAHLAGCPRCVAFVRAYRETPRIVRESTAIEIPEGLAASLQKFLAERRRG
ncbi:MAG TPA: zf-HC2 domain-containing protein [Dongiaceae bacterium]|nr:zf-HC2 domain-containing protein [Dongiaceae bacterium]